VNRTEMAVDGRGTRNPVLNPQLISNATELLATINTMAAASRDSAAGTNRAVDRMNRNNGNPNNTDGEGDGADGRLMTLATFLKVKPPKFKGTVNATEAYDWFQAIERSFHAQQVSAEQYVEFATYMLQGEAQH
ncbi:hypothetical protein PIB30_089798, partial [Stylosanthes scabra]|nr:hypothetical protein [Stylosanthes scabra]